MAKLIILLLPIVLALGQEQSAKIFTDNEASKKCKGHFQGAPSFVHAGSHVHVFIVCGNAKSLGNSVNKTGHLGDAIKGAICVRKSSTNGGRSWANFSQVSPSGMTEIGACKGVYDAYNSRIVLQYSHCPTGDCATSVSEGKAKWFQTTSDDEGQKWSSPKDLTSMLTAGECPEVPGQVAGNRIQLRDTHRLLWAGESKGKPCFWYSDDGGDTYKTQYVTNVKQPNEFSLVQTKEGDVYMNGRNQENKVCPNDERREYWSKDGGETWKGPECSSLKDAPNGAGHGCEASMTYHEGALFFLNPSSHGTERQKMKVHCSLDSAKTWPYSYKVTSTKIGGYSDLVVTNKGTQLLLGFDGDGSTNVWAVRIGLDWCKGSMVV